jgi:hypothetical protein
MKRPSISNRLLVGSSYIEVETFDVMAINGHNTDLPLDKHHEQVRTLRRHFVPVHRVRVDDRDIKVQRNEAGEELWRVGDQTMPESEMLELAREYAPLAPPNLGLNPTGFTANPKIMSKEIR